MVIDLLTFDLQVLESGGFRVDTLISGVDASGTAFVRTTQQFFVALDSNLELQTTAIAQMKDQDTVQVLLQITGAQVGATGYIAYAEVWGTDASGKAVAVAWISGITEPEQLGKNREECIPNLLEQTAPRSSPWNSICLSLGSPKQMPKLHFLCKTSVFKEETTKTIWQRQPASQFNSMDNFPQTPTQLSEMQLKSLRK
jgi:hypothetical protein